MGWTSSADPLENVARTSWTFYTKEQVRRWQQGGSSSNAHSHGRAWIQCSYNAPPSGGGAHAAAWMMAARHATAQAPGFGLQGMAGCACKHRC